METRQCPRCGQTIMSTARECRYCGMQLDATEDYVQNTTCNASPGVLSTPVPPMPTRRFAPAGTGQRKPVGFFERYFLMTFVRPYADFGGYTTRKEYWLTVVALYIFSFAVAGLGFLITALAGAAGWIVAIVLWGIFGLGLCIPSWAILCRRLRDGGFSPWLILLFLIPGIGGLIIFILTLLPSKYQHEKVPMRFSIADLVITLLGPVMLGIGIWFYAGGLGHSRTYHDYDDYDSDSRYESSYDDDDDFDSEAVEEVVGKAQAPDYSWAWERPLSESDLYGLSPDELRLARNAIYAHHGYIFQSPELTQYFSQFDWYQPRYTDVNNMLSDMERDNVYFIKAHE